MMRHTYGLPPNIVLDTRTEVDFADLSNGPFGMIRYSGRVPEPRYIPPHEDDIVRYACGQLDTPVLWC